MIFSTIHHRLKCKCSRLYGINAYILGVSFKYYNTNKIIKNTSDIKIKIYIFFFLLHELLTYFWDRRWNGQATCREKYYEGDVEEHGCCHGEVRARNNFAWRRKLWNVASISNFADTSVSIAFAVPFTDHAIQTFQYLSRINFYCTFVPIESPCKLNARSLEEATN